VWASGIRATILPARSFHETSIVLQRTRRRGTAVLWVSGTIVVTTAGSDERCDGPAGEGVLEARVVNVGGIEAGIGVRVRSGEAKQFVLGGDSRAVPANFDLLT